MAINFPNSPQLDDTYTEGNRSWRWNGVYWRATSATVGYTGSKGDQGESFRILGSVATVNDLPADSSGLPGDGYIIIDTGDLYVWDGFNWNNNGRIVGYTGSRGVPGASVKLLGSVATEQDLPTDGTSDGSTLLVAGEAYIVQSSGNLFVWNGSEFTDVGKITGETGPIGYTGSIGFTGSVGFVGSRGESTFTWGDTAPENPEVGARWFYTTEGLLLVYTDDGDSQQWVEVSATGFQGQSGFTGSAGLSGVLVQTVTYVAQATAADTQGGETLGIVGAGFNSGITVYIDSTECATTLVDSSNLTFVSPAKTAGVYDIVVYNTDGSSGTRPQGIEYSGAPVWTTQPSLPVQNKDSAISIILSATSNSSVTYFLQQGSSMPAGLSLSSSGTISGTVTGIEEDTVYSFTVVAIDAESQTTPRSFSLTVLVGVAVEYLVVAGGGGGGSAGGGGGAGGFRTDTGFLITPETAFTVTVGAGGAGGGAGASRGGSGTGSVGIQGSPSVFSSITSAGGGAGQSEVGVGTTGGSGGGGSHSGPAGLDSGLAGNTPPTSPAQGNAGGNGQVSGGNAAGGGGGGAGGPGGNGQQEPSAVVGGTGGIGSESTISGTAVTYAGGGGGGIRGGGIAGTGGGTGGAGGGGTGASSANPAPSGTQHLGGGGGGGGHLNNYGNQGAGGAGGSGVVILKYSNSFTLINADEGLTFTTSTAVAGYKITTFTAGTGNIVFYRNSDVIETEYLVIAGGGGAGNSSEWNAGGGAGGYRTNAGTSGGGAAAEPTLILFNTTNYTVTVGAGGSRAVQGGSSVFSSISTTGGGKGGGAATGATAPGGNGGSGGGGSANGYAGGNGISGQGFNGGSGSGSNNGGGGGAGGSGGNAAGATGGAGGTGANSSITGTEVTRAVGGDGDAGGTNGTTNTGNGGNGAGGSAAGGSGGSGVVIIAYPDSHPAITTISAGLVYDQPTRAGYRVYRFTAGTGNVTF